ncbi:hypothetical protein ILUMI_01477 [Ignelater luminosus]|uniref:Palmitoyl-protein thioesterase 1 n=1 Tax=Ignelater luminosus TaxID=2038154 RepID=A0A8K0GHE8_IGNLU|nr:hypothetical protein ILUMI_01477 [Ignelater luminosus]
MCKNSLKVALILLFAILNVCKCYTPIVIWHGIGDTCCNNTITGHLQKLLQAYLPGSHVISLQIGSTKEEDLINSYNTHPDKQIRMACHIIQSDPLLANGYNGIGFSQGSQLMRGLAQRCGKPKMKNLITMAGQHQGVYGVPECNATAIPACDAMRKLINNVIYLKALQEELVPATYWHNPLNTNKYIKRSTYLADINNERNINEAYIENLQALDNFVMVRHGADEVVQPTESSWFGFYKDGQSSEIETLPESELYKSDRLGLKQMDKKGKLHFLLNDWKHAAFEWNWFRENIVDTFLK